MLNSTPLDCMCVWYFVLGHLFGCLCVECSKFDYKDVGL